MPLPNLYFFSWLILFLLFSSSLRFLTHNPPWLRRENHTIAIARDRLESPYSGFVLFSLSLSCCLKSSQEFKNWGHRFLLCGSWYRQRQCSIAMSPRSFWLLTGEGSILAMELGLTFISIIWRVSTCWGPFIYLLLEINEIIEKCLQNSLHALDLEVRSASITGSIGHWLL
jgi:hypothetical protein